MIQTRDALQLAVTKLRTRRVRLAVTVVITSLLFAVLTFLAFFTQGAIHSVQEFSKEGYGGRYLVQSTPAPVQSDPYDKKLIEHLKPLNADLIAKKKVRAKALNLTYDEKTDPTLPLTTAPGPGSPGEVFPNFTHQAVATYFEEQARAIKGADYESFAQKATSAGASKTYRGTQQSFGFTGPESKSVSVLENGQEKFDTLANSANYGMEGPKGIQTITSVGWGSIDPELMLPFLLPGQTLAVGKDGAIPTIAPMSAAEEVLGLKPLPATATSQQKLDRLIQVRKEIAGKTAKLCYRNASSSTLVSQTVDQQKEITANKNKKDYVKPSLIYKLPTDPCGPVAVQADTRTAEEKKQADNQRIFDKEFGNYVEPEQGIVTVRIIGLSPDLSFSASLSASAVLQSLFSSSLGGRWISPNEAIVANAVATKVQGSNVETASRNASVYYAEFPTLAAMEAFIKDQACDELEQVSTPMGVQSMSMGPNACIQKGKVLSVYPFGNSAGAIEEFRSGTWQVVRIILVVILIIASVIMMGNIGKIIADSRRETAVFRALGAKRLDIDQIYLTYSVLLSLLIAAVAILIGAVVAMYLDNRYSDELSVTAVLTYGAQDVARQFSLFGINFIYLGAIIGLIILSGLLSASIPLMTNTRRNPIRDMRDET